MDNNNSLRDILNLPSRDTFFSPDSLKPISPIKKASPRRVQSEIENNPGGVSAYSLFKKLGISYPTVARICKTLEYAEVIKSKVIIGENNRAVKLFFPISSQPVATLLSNLPVEGQKTTMELHDVNSSDAHHNKKEHSKEGDVRGNKE